MGTNFYSKRILKLLSVYFFLSFSFFEINTINKQIKAEKNLIAATEKDLFLYRQMGASYLCISSKAEVDFKKGLGIASATFANVITGKHGGLIKEFGNEKLSEKKLIAASEKDIFLYRQMGASYLCIASKAEVDFNKGLGIASATFANVIIGKHGGAIKELGNEKLDEKKLYNAGTFQIVGSALNICPESIPKNIKKDYEKRLKQLEKQAKK